MKINDRFFGCFLPCCAFFYVDTWEPQGLWEGHKNTQRASRRREAFDT